MGAWKILLLISHLLHLKKVKTSLFFVKKKADLDLYLIFSLRDILIKIILYIHIEANTHYNFIIVKIYGKERMCIAFLSMEKVFWEFWTSFEASLRSILLFLMCVPLRKIFLCWNSRWTVTGLLKISRGYVRKDTKIIKNFLRVCLHSSRITRVRSFWILLCEYELRLKALTLFKAKALLCFALPNCTLLFHASL